jgi:hypothetical protein
VRGKVAPCHVVPLRRPPRCRSRDELGAQVTALRAAGMRHRPGRTPPTWHLFLWPQRLSALGMLLGQQSHRRNVDLLTQSELARSSSIRPVPSRSIGRVASAPWFGSTEPEQVEPLFYHRLKSGKQGNRRESALRPGMVTTHLCCKSPRQHSCSCTQQAPLPRKSWTVEVWSDCAGLAGHWEILSGRVAYGEGFG